MNAITSPTLVVDREKCENNIRAMAGRARSHGARLRPHMKTHQSADIGNWMRDAGITGITVSSVAMAEYFARHGWEDITIAFPVNILEIKRLNNLANKCSISILVSDEATFPVLEQHLAQPLNAYLEIDSGAGRTGLRWDDTGRIAGLLEQIRSHERLRLRGLYSHPGHSYSARSPDEIRRVNEEVHSRLTGLRRQLDLSPEELPLCVGDTPCCSAGDRFEGIAEWSPGNFVFYDLMQTRIGACRTEDIAVALACPVVARHPERGEVTVHGGAVHLSKDRIEEEGRTHYGRVVRFGDSGWSQPIEGCYMDRISQEHGTVTLSREASEIFSPGDLLGILPVHSCLTADLMAGYRTLSGLELDHIRAC